MIPSAASFSSTCFCAAIAPAHHARSCASVAYRAFASFCATDGVDSTTIIRDPVGTAARGSPTSPRQLADRRGGGRPAAARRGRDHAERDRDADQREDGDATR